ncbi:calnexin precursor [Fusarium napiforme]|uniref:Calnexin n=1 Tax=Fusarium napiforme TaxID=42672 RepID=A0A8H5I770_9HYPO|nr:calnexin precursor [Fusarium napiforme]
MDQITATDVSMFLYPLRLVGEVSDGIKAKFMNPRCDLGPMEERVNKIAAQFTLCFWGMLKTGYKVQEEGGDGTHRAGLDGDRKHHRERDHGGGSAHEEETGVVRFKAMHGLLRIGNRPVRPTQLDSHVYARYGCGEELLLGGDRKKRHQDPLEAESPVARLTGRTGLNICTPDRGGANPLRKREWLSKRRQRSEEMHWCGGAYIKLLANNEASYQEEFANTIPYVVMFAPDKSGHTNNVHFVTRTLRLAGMRSRKSSMALLSSGSRSGPWTWVRYSLAVPPVYHRSVLVVTLNHHAIVDIPSLCLSR